MPLTPQKEVAILIFANSSAEELRHKNVPKSDELFDKLTRQTLATVIRTQLPYFHLTEAHQTGNSFGERFTNAIQHVFDKGFKKIITIGNDTPHLRTSHILKAVSFLEDERAVIGPSADGGFYLMGLCKAHFEAATMEKLAWQTSALMGQVKSMFCAKHVVPELLETYNDIDSTSDVKAILKVAHSLNRYIRNELMSLLIIKEEILHRVLTIIASFYTSSYYNKGSPTLKML